MYGVMYGYILGCIHTHTHTHIYIYNYIKGLISFIKKYKTVHGIFSPLRPQNFRHGLDVSICKHLSFPQCSASTSKGILFMKLQVAWQ